MLNAEHRAALRSEFDAAIQDIITMRGSPDSDGSPANLTSAFYAAIGDSVFEAGVSALQDGSEARSTSETLGALGTAARLHVVSAPVGSGKTSFAMALIAAVVRLQSQDTSGKAVSAQAAPPPFGCLWVVDEMQKADEMYRAVLTPLLAPGEQLLGALQATQSKTFSAKI